jgi:hypothetical protein
MRKDRSVLFFWPSLCFSSPPRGAAMTASHSRSDLTGSATSLVLAGYEDLNDAERLSQDPAFRLLGSRKIWERGAALTSRSQSFETELLTRKQTSPV